MFWSIICVEFVLGLGKEKWKLLQLWVKKLIPGKEIIFPFFKATKCVLGMDAFLDFVLLAMKYTCPEEQ